MEDIMPLGQGRVIGEAIPMRDILRISIEVAIGLRKSMSAGGIPQIADFVNGLAFAGLLLQKNYRPEDGPTLFVEHFCEGLDAYADVLSGPQYESQRRDMIAHGLAVVDQSPTEILVTAGLSAEETISTIADEYGLSAGDVMELVTIAIALAVVSATPADNREIVLEGIKQGVVEKSATWDQLIPSDAELFGDDDDEDDEG